MRTQRITMRTIAGMTLWASLAAGQADAQVKTEDVLARKPVQPGIVVSTPTGADLAGCRAEQVTWPKNAGAAAPTGVVVKDAQGRLVRQFIDTSGSNDPTKANIWSYYQNGQEVYREVDGNGNGKPDQYRWLGGNGTKWGIDINEDGLVDTWHMISPEEVSQELFIALLAKDTRRVEALLPSDQDLKSIGIPDAEIAKIKVRTAGAVKRMQDTAESLKLTAEAKWIHLELGIPNVTPADSFGGRDDLMKYRTGTVLVDKGDGKSAEVFQTGELLLIGRSWKLIEGPMPGSAPPASNMGDPNGEGINVPEEARKLVEELSKIQSPSDISDRAGMLKYHTARAAILEKIVGLTKGAQQEPWLKQVVDAYAAAAETGDAQSLQRLQQWLASIEQTAPKSATAGYAAFRVVSSEYGVKLSQVNRPDAKPDDLAKVQAWWRESLEKFVNAYPSAEDAPEAINRLAIAFEYMKDGDAQAKVWYERMVKDYATHPMATKAQGAIKRLTSEGQPFSLNAQTFDGKAFSAAQLNGKAVIVYFWATWGRETAAEMKQLTELAKTHGPKGLEILTINLDEEPAKAVAAINAAQLPGTHLHAPGGLDRSPLAAAYGIQMVPHLFLVGKDGKVVDRNAQTGPSLKDQVEKMVK